MSRRAERTGDVHGVFLVLGPAGSKGKQSLWECLCQSCGSKVIRENRYFRKDRPVPKSCLNCKGPNHFAFRGYKGLSKTYLSRIKIQAEERGLSYNVTPEYLWELFEDQNGECYLTGLKLSFGKDQTASLDRVDSEQGYEKGNLKWCHKDINKMKMDLSLERFLELCSLVRKPNVKEVT